MSTGKPRKPSVPRGLSQRAGKVWRATVQEFEMSASELEVLRSALIALDRADAAAAILKREGVVVLDRYGTPKQHPAFDAELRSRTSFMRAVRQLGIELAEAGPESPVTRKARAAAQARWGSRVTRIESRRARAGAR